MQTAGVPRTQSWHDACVLAVATKMTSAKPHKDSFEYLPTDLIQRITACLPTDSDSDSDSETRRCSSFSSWLL